MKEIIVAGNWKMHKSVSEVESFFQEARNFNIPQNVKCIIAPSPILLHATVLASHGSHFEIYSQNCHWEKSGAFTGECSPQQIKESGATGTLVGHSERRQYFGETTATCLQRIEGARAAGLKVIYCIGEQLKDRQASQTEEVLTKQLESIVPIFSSDNEITLAYEPVWAIGTGVTATVEQVQDTHQWISLYLKKHSCNWKILYGGSVKPNNFASLTAIPTVSGGLIGGASLEAESFRSLLGSIA